MVLPRTWIMSMYPLLKPTGLIAVALFLKLSVPSAMALSVSRAPIIWSSLLSWLRPPYLYLVINGIIIAIAASSRFHPSNDDEEDKHVIINSAGKIPTEQIFLPPKPASISAVDPSSDPPSAVEFVGLPPKNSAVADHGGFAQDGGDDESVVSSSPWNPPVRTVSWEIRPENPSPVEKPPASSRFSHRKTVKSSPEGGRALKVAKPKRHETLENTWKMITDGRSMPLTRHMKKSDTWKNHSREINLDPSLAEKPENFKDPTNYQPESTASPVRLRKESSLSQDELNRRVEAFIKNFNVEMRLQRLESLKQYKKIIAPGV